MSASAIFSVFFVCAGSFFIGIIAAMNTQLKQGGLTEIAASRWRDTGRILWLTAFAQYLGAAVFASGVLR